MPAFTAETPRLPVTIHEVAYTVPAVFAAAHVLTEAEAGFLNRQLATYIANPIGTAVGKAKKDGKPVDFGDGKSDVQAEIDRRFGEFVVAPSNRGSGDGSSAATPLDRMINFLASEKLKALIIAKGSTVRAFQTTKYADGINAGKSAWAVQLEVLIGRDLAKLTAQAQAALDDLSSDEGLDLGTPEAGPSTEDTAVNTETPAEETPPAE